MCVWIDVLIFHICIFYHSSSYHPSIGLYIFADMLVYRSRNSVYIYANNDITHKH